MFKKIVIVFSLMFCVVKGLQAQTSYTIYYFYTNIRCSTCRNFERMTSELAPSLSIPFKSINTDEKENFHYLTDYGLYTKSVVIADNKGHFKNLDKIWNYAKNENIFKNYIITEVKTFIKENP